MHISVCGAITAPYNSFKNIARRETNENCAVISQQRGRRQIAITREGKRENDSGTKIREGGKERERATKHHG